jgi:hypothetical protein
MTNELFLAQFRSWITAMRRLAAHEPGTGACTLASAMELWLWTLEHLVQSGDAEGQKLYHSNRQGVTFPMADALCWLLASRQQILDVQELREQGPLNPAVAEGLEGTLQFLTDLCHMQAGRTAGETSRICSTLVYGYMRHPSWDGNCDSCLKPEELYAIEGLVPGASSFTSDFIREDGTHDAKAGPCVHPEGVGDFIRLRTKLDGCMAGTMLARDRAAASIQKVMIPAALDYPQ